VLAQEVQIVQPVAVDRQGPDLEVQTQQAVPVAQGFGHCLVLGGAVEQQAANRQALLAPLAQRAERRQHSGLDAFGGATDEQQASVAGADQAPRALAHLVHHGPGLQAGGVDAAGGAEIVGHGLQGGLPGLGEHRRGGIRVEVDFHGH
jgi:hypothetical protein